jgi:hypothetical protein
MLDGLTTGLPVALDWPNRRTQSVMTAKAKWKIYEEVAHYLLETQAKALGLGLERVERKQKLIGESGTTWEIDRKGVTTDVVGRSSPSSVADTPRPSSSRKTWRHWRTSSATLALQAGGPASTRRIAC